MPSITTWTRLEPKSRSADLRSGLQARFHDPLWSLARQWQIGEFEGEDAASPVSVRLRADVARLSRVHTQRLSTAGTTGELYDSARVPLETIVEREKVLHDGLMQPDVHHRYEAGLHFLRLLDHHTVGQYRRDYINRYALLPPADSDALDNESRRFLDVLGPRVVDGSRLYNDLRIAFPIDQAELGGLPALPRIDANDRTNVEQAARAWLDWYERLFSEPTQDQSAWVAERMEYAFSVAASGRDAEHVLEASEYSGGHLDWYAFDRRGGMSLGAQNDNAPELITQTVIPTPVNYRGMPAARWWEFEDAQIDFGAIDAGPDDLLRLLMIDFALEYGNDWFVLPVEQPVGTLSHIRSLVVSDCFGGRTLIEPYSLADSPNNDWHMYRVGADDNSGARNSSEGLFLAPVLADSLHSDPIEEVLFLRDEMSNMAWAVERVIQSQAGIALKRYELYQEREASRENETNRSVAESDVFEYKLTTRVPDYWTPLLPVREDANDPAIRLRRGRLLQGDNELRIPLPLGRLLEPGRDLRLFEEEVPRAGARVTRAYQRARWIDGSTHAWIGRRKSSGRGEGFSGLRFDLLDRTQGNTESDDG